MTVTWNAHNTAAMRKICEQHTETRLLQRVSCRTKANACRSWWRFCSAFLWLSQNFLKSWNNEATKETLAVFGVSSKQLHALLRQLSCSECFTFTKICEKHCKTWPVATTFCPTKQRRLIGVGVGTVPFGCRWLLKAWVRARRALLKNVGLEVFGVWLQMMLERSCLKRIKSSARKMKELF